MPLSDIKLLPWLLTWAANVRSVRSASEAYPLPCADRIRL